jgi:hypothetical protein
METTIQKYSGPEGSAELVSLTFEGVTVTAFGACVDEVNGRAAGYVKGETLTTCGGEVLGTLRETGRWRRKYVGRTYAPHTVYAYAAVIGGKRYHGRGAGEGMLLTLRRAK